MSNASTPTPFNSPQSPRVNAYLKTRVMSASPAELRLMLLDGAVKFARQGRDGLAKKDYEAVYNGVTQCRAIIVELMTNMKEGVDPDLAQKVKSLYGFIFNELTTASLEKSVPKMDKVIEILDYERETWALLLEKLAKEKTGEKATAVSLQG